jgi:hypothetical protein
MKIYEVNTKKMHHRHKGDRQEIGDPASAFDPGRRVRGADKRLSAATYH